MRTVTLKTIMPTTRKMPIIPAPEQRRASPIFSVVKPSPSVADIEIICESILNILNTSYYLPKKLRTIPPAITEAT